MSKEPSKQTETDETLALIQKLRIQTYEMQLRKLLTEISKLHKLIEANKRESI